MNRTELASSVAEKTGLSKKDSEAVVAAFLDTIQQELANGGKIQLLGFGTFEVKDRPERTGVNPSTKQPITIPASRQPVFKAGKALKDALNQ